MARSGLIRKSNPESRRFSETRQSGFFCFRAIEFNDCRLGVFNTCVAVIYAEVEGFSLVDGSGGGDVIDCNLSRLLGGTAVFFEEVDLQLEELVANCDEVICQQKLQRIQTKGLDLDRLK